MSDEELYQKALDFATEKHKGQYRIGGSEYITHPIAVAEIVKEKGYGIEYRITGLFHDLLEDTDATEEEIRSIGGERVLTAVKLLTKQKGYVMQDYVDGIKSNPIAYVVKGADRLHNLRSATCASEDFKRRYVLESIDWYLDFDKEIVVAVKQLAKTMQNPIAELNLKYKPINKWKIKKEGK